MLYLYTVIEAIIAVVAGIFIALRTKKAEHVTYGKFDRIGQITNILLLLVYICFAPLYLFLGMISNPAHEGFLGILGWVVSVIMASASLFCGLGLGFSVAFRKQRRVRLASRFNLRESLVLDLLFCCTLFSQETCFAI